jgi:uncharacterized protein with HEPN domain
MSPSTREILQHILAETQYLIGASTEVHKEEFLADETLRRAFVRSLEIIGEAAKRYRLTFAVAIPRSSGGRFQR